jgi:hypothetical protein
LLALLVLLVLLVPGVGSTVAAAPPLAAGRTPTAQDHSGLALPAATALTAANQLAARYSPIAELKRQTAPCDDVGEPYAPAPVDLVLGDPAVVLRRDTGVADAANDPIVRRAPTVADLAGKDGSVYLDLPGDPRDPGCDYERAFKARMGTQPPVVYAHVATQAGHHGIALQYWFYYVFNRFNNLHESDWEMIQLSFDAATAQEALTKEPDEVAFAQHEGGEVAGWHDSKLQKDGTHPIVFPAAGSHATYFGNHVYLGWGERGAGLGCDDGTGPSLRVPLHAVLVPDHPTPGGPFAWLTYRGLWGEKDAWPYSGPTGPALKRRWTEPFTWQHGLRKTSLALPAQPMIGPNPTEFFCQGVRGGAMLFTLKKHYPWVAYGVIALLLAVPAGLLFLTRRPLGAAVVLVARHAPTFLALGAVLAGFGIVANWFEGAMRALPGGGIPFDLLDLASPSQFVVGNGGSLEPFVGWLLVTPAVVYTVAGLQAGRKPGVRAAYRFALARWRTMLLASARAAVVVIGLTFTVVGIPWAVAKAVRWLCLVQAVVLEDAGWREARRESEQAVIGRWWRTAALWLVVTLLLALLALVVGLVVLIFVTPSVLVANIVSGVAYALLFPLVGIATTLWYQERPERAVGPRPRAGWWRWRPRMWAQAPVRPTSGTTSPAPSPPA